MPGGTAAHAHPTMLIRISRAIDSELVTLILSPAEPGCTNASDTGHAAPRRIASVGLLADEAATSSTVVADERPRSLACFPEAGCHSVGRSSGLLLGRR